ncbi:MAG: Uncharacterised protein [Cryomorphaceae bacterium]|nr:MAG: Uncharacterised protein [Cryomorphaceae bacterium]
MVLRKRENIHDAPTNGELARLNDKIYTFKLVFKEGLVEKIQTELIPKIHFEGIGFQFLFRHHLLE